MGLRETPKRDRGCSHVQHRRHSLLITVKVSIVMYTDYVQEQSLVLYNESPEKADETKLMSFIVHIVLYSVLVHCLFLKIISYKE